MRYFGVTTAIAIGRKGVHPRERCKVATAHVAATLDPSRGCTKRSTSTRSFPG
jgi:hypothetical protein